MLIIKNCNLWTMAEENNVKRDILVNGKTIEYIGEINLTDYPNAEVISNISSTIIDLTVNPYTVIREGSIKYNEIMSFLNK